MEKKFYEEYYDTFLDLSEAPEEDALTEEEVRYYISENFEPYNEAYVGDIVFVKKFIYEDGNIGSNHLFVIVDKNKFIDIEYFGMILSSKIDKEKFKYNFRLNKDSGNGLNKDSIIKTGHIYKLNSKDVLKKVGTINMEMIDYFNRKYKEYLNGKC